MNPTMRRAMTVLGATVGAIALSSGTAFAHYCYLTDAPEGSKMVKGQAWMTQAEMLEGFQQVRLPEPCKSIVLGLIEDLPEDTLFMGPGLLAGGAVPQGRGPDGMGHLAVDALAYPECAFLAEE